jgi:hypothetical protein
MAQEKAKIPEATITTQRPFINQEFYFCSQIWSIGYKLFASKRQYIRAESSEALSKGSVFT